MALTSSALKKIAGSGDQNLFVYQSADARSGFSLALSPLTTGLLTTDLLPLTSPLSL